MKITITCRHSDFSQKLQDHTATHVEGLERFGEHFENGEIVFDKEHGKVTCELILHRHAGEPFVANDSCDDGRTAIDNVVDKVKRQIIKYKETHSAKTRRHDEAAYRSNQSRNK
ncbi:MAG: ribosome-associated translation inhibitor RaiA [Planctomycetes bacterium]|nr:ribosome-associated translation inhibitor RaiA [Planctomycetota bacterium]